MSDKGSLFSLEEKSRPILKWAGGKSSLLPQLLKYFPEHFDRYLEPFLGGGAVFLSLAKSTPAIVNDCNKELYELYSVLRDNPKEVALVLDYYSKEYSEEFYYALRINMPKSEIEKVARTIFLNKTGFNGLYRKNTKGFFNVPFGKRKFCPSLYEHSNLLAVSDRLKQCEIYNLDFEEILAMARPGDFIYCDPPYEPLSSTASFNAYTGNRFGQNEQIRLKEACVKAARRGAFVAISNSSSAFILDLYKDFNLQKLYANRVINSDGQKRGQIEEVLVLMVDKKTDQSVLKRHLQFDKSCSV